MDEDEDTDLDPSMDFFAVVELCRRDGNIGGIVVLASGERMRGKSLGGIVAPIVYRGVERWRESNTVINTTTVFLAYFSKRKRMNFIKGSLRLLMYTMLKYKGMSQATGSTHLRTLPHQTRALSSCLMIIHRPTGEIT